MKQEDIIERVAEDTGFSEDLVKFVIDDLFKSLNWWLRNPLACGKKIIVEGVFKFYIPAFRLGKHIAKTEDKIKEIPERKEYYEAKLFYLNKLSEQIGYEGQTRDGYEHARHSASNRKKRQEQRDKEEALYPGYTAFWREQRKRRREEQERIQRKDQRTSD